MGIVINNTTGEIDLNATTPGIYEVTYTTNGSCPTTVKNTITVNALDGATFAYSSNSLPQTGTASLTTTPTTSGGVFSAYPSGLSINSSTGEIDLANSTIQSYKIFYETSGAGCPNSSTFDLAVTPSFTNTKSILLDGLDDFVDIDHTSLSGATNFSVSLWLNRSADIGTEFFSIYAGSSLKFFLATRGGQRLDIWLNGNYVGYKSNFLSTPPNYNHLVVTFDGSQAVNSDKVKVYINGLEDTGFPTSTSATSLPSGLTKMYIGKRIYFYEGNIDEVSVFNTTISQSDVTSIYNSGVPNDISSLSPLNWWRMGDGDTAPTLTDNGSGGNNGTMTNFSTFSTDVPT